MTLTEEERVKEWNTEYAHIYAEQPIDERIYRILEDFVEPYTKRMIELKIEGATIKYSPESIDRKFQSFNSCVAYLVYSYLQASERIRDLARTMKQEHVKKAEATEMFLAYQGAYGRWQDILRESASELLHAIEYANAHKLIEDGPERERDALKLENARLESIISQLRTDLKKCREDAEAYKKIHPLGSGKTETGDTDDAPVQ